jgi:DNA-binding transcriptional MerR regulator/effector-binding domain-containing protein
VTTVHDVPTAAVTLERVVDPLLSIGEFSRRSRLSPKALRLYERRGLLVPAHVDGDTRYRRYDESQLETARLIAVLRGLDMPLAVVAELVAAPETERVRVLDDYWARREARLASQRRLVTHLRIQLAGEEGSYDMYEVRERDVPEQVMLTEQRHVLVPELPEFIGSAGMRLLNAADAHGGVAGPMVVIYHGAVNEDSDGPVEVCIPVRSAPRDGGDVLRREPAHREAYVRITKAEVEYPQILSAYEAVEQWIRNQGKTLAGSPREVYFADWDASAPTDEVCDVVFPMA